MMSLEPSYIPNTAEVAAEVLDGEAVLINLTNGMYYSLVGTGSFVWTVLEDSASAHDIVSALVSQYEVGIGVAQTDANQLIEDLMREGLILQSSEAKSSPSLETTVQRQHYEAPRLKVYSDMQALLALDPPMPDLTDAPWKQSDAKA